MEVPRHWRLRQSKLSLVGNCCLECNNLSFPPRDICPNCNLTPIDKPTGMIYQADQADSALFTKEQATAGARKLPVFEPSR
ncbi:zinc ribbon domain-containing protein [Patescibacteria group bacterium]